MTALEMLNELIRQGFIVPVGDQANPDFSMPTAYESVESITTYGSEPVEGDENAELGCGS
jgi:hypothetical protein